MSEIREDSLTNKERMQKGELQMALMKMVAEQNREKFIEYDCDADRFVISEVKNGNFHLKAEIENFFTQDNYVLNSISNEDRDLFYKEVDRCRKKPSTYAFDIRVDWENRGDEWYRVFMTSIADENRTVKYIAARLVSIHAQKLAQEMMRIEAERDSLSGVYTRKTYEQICNDITSKYDEGILFMMVDIDDFKQVNDTYGHHVGDSVIRHVGNVLETIAKGQGAAGRLGGDEFSLCVYGVYSKEVAISICLRIKEALRQLIEGVGYTCSMGVALSN